MGDEDVPAAEQETPELIEADVADGDDVPDMSEGVPQDHEPAEGSPS